MALDRQTLDMTGARTGEIFEHTLQFGDETVTLANIATMAVETDEFQPFDMPGNRSRQRLALVAASFAFIAGVLTGAWWALSGAGWLSPIAGSTIGLFLLFVLLTGRGLYLSHKIRKVQPYYRLRIGASDGHTVYLVDDNRTVLEEVRDAIRRKIDMNDHTITARFDLNADTVSVDPDADTALAEATPQPPSPATPVAAAPQPTDPSPAPAAVTPTPPATPST